MSHSKKKSNKVSRNQKRTRDVGPASQKCQNIFWKKETQKKKSWRWTIALQSVTNPFHLNLALDPYGDQWSLLSVIQLCRKCRDLQAPKSPRRGWIASSSVGWQDQQPAYFWCLFHLVAFRVIRAMGAYIEQDGNKWMIDFKRPGFFFFAAPSHNLDALEKEWARTRVVVNIE